MKDRKEIEVLVVDDKNSCLNAVIDALKRAGFRVINFKDGAEDVATIEKAYLQIVAENPDLVILDVRLKDGLSLELVKRFQGRKQPKWIVHSDEWKAEDIRKQYKDLGAQRGAVKFDMEGLIAAIDEAIQEPQGEIKASLAKFHDLPLSERLGIFHDHLAALCAIDLDLQRIASATPDQEVQKIQQRLFTAIESLRDFVLKDSSN